MELISVATVDNDIRWLKLINGYLNRQTDMFVAWSVSDPESVVMLFEYSPVAVVLIDANIKERNYLINKLSDQKSAKIIIVADQAGEDSIIQSFRAGAMHYIQKKDLKEIPVQIRAILSSQSPFEVVLKDYQKLLMEEKLQVLTYTEKKIVLELKNGYSKEMICEKFCIALTTYKKHISNIIDKFQVKSVKEVLNHINNNG
ncbi:MAG TPA: response regulator [Bacillota bacterium]|nr:response regulator [Bacillota bacterium]